jgi:S-adenosylmethionine synthetase
VACEVFAFNNRLIVAGEFHAKAGVVDEVKSVAEQLIRSELRAIGYKNHNDMCPDTCKIEVEFNDQSREINDAIKCPEHLGAGDQGIMFGYACDETPELMPLAWSLATQLIKRMQFVIKMGFFGEVALSDAFCADGKSQVTIRYAGGKPIGVQSVVLSWQHSEQTTLEEARRILEMFVIDNVIPAHMRTSDFVMHINPGGPFTVGGPKSDTGLTGRKIIVDTYGGAAPHGGGAFSGKDSSKVDRSAAYAARWVAKNIVSSGLARQATVQLSYAIGVTRPISISVDTAGSGNVADSVIEEAIHEVFDLSPSGIIDQLKLTRPIFKETSSLGHFGRDPDIFLWERTDKELELLSSVERIFSKNQMIAV